MDTPDQLPLTAEITLDKKRTWRLDEKGFKILRERVGQPEGNPPLGGEEGLLNGVMILWAGLHQQLTEEEFMEIARENPERLVEALQVVAQTMQSGNLGGGGDGAGEALRG